MTALVIAVVFAVCMSIAYLLGLEVGYMRGNGVYNEWCARVDQELDEQERRLLGRVERHAAYDEQVLRALDRRGET